MNKEMAETLVRTGPGTAMGNLMRRCSTPVLQGRRRGAPAAARHQRGREAAAAARLSRAARRSALNRVRQMA